MRSVGFTLVVVAAVASVVVAFRFVPSAQMPVHRQLVGGTIYGAPVRMLGGRVVQAESHEPVESTRSCLPVWRVRVVRPDGSTVTNALVIVEAIESQHAVEETVAIYRYEAEARATDRLGETTVCTPRSLVAWPSFGLGDERIVARSGSATAELRAPFHWPLRLVLAR